MSDTKTGYTVMDTYNFIINYAKTHGGNSPSYGKIAAGCGFSKPTAFASVKQLVTAGLLEQRDGEIIIAGANLLVPGELGQGGTVSDADIFAMRVIPKEMIFNGRHKLSDYKITVGEAINAEFLHAQYPAGWRYERSSNPHNLSPTYLLLDESDYPRAILRLEPEDGRASVRFWP